MAVPWGWRGGLCAAVVAAAGPGCHGSFAIEPTEVPKLRSGEVRTIDGELEQVPEHWTAEVQPRDPPGSMRVGDARARTTSVEEEVRFSSPAQAGIAPFGLGLAASRGDAPPPGAPAASPPALWLRSDDGRILEIELGAIDRVVVKGKGEGIGTGGIVGIVVGSCAAGAAFIAAMWVLSDALSSTGDRE